MVVAFFVGLVFTSALPTPTTAQQDPFQSLTDEAARELVDLLEQVDVAEAAEDWYEGVRIYREMWQILPMEEYRFGEAYCLEQLGDVAGAVELLSSLSRSPREEVRHAAASQLEPLRTSLGLVSAADAVDAAQTQGALDAAAAAVEPPSPTVEPTERTIWPPILLGTLAFLAVGNGVAFGIVAEERAQDAHDYDVAQPGATHLAVEQLNDDADTFATVANASFAAAGALAVSAVLVWFLTAPDGEENPGELTVSPILFDGTAGAVLRVTF